MLVTDADPKRPNLDQYALDASGSGSAEKMRIRPDPDRQHWSLVDCLRYLFAVVFPLVLKEVGGTVEALQANVALMFPT